MCVAGALSACTVQQQSNAVTCALDLAASGVRDPQALLIVASRTPSCMTLAADALAQAIAQAANR
jgi:hypothetical protein